MSAGFRGGGSRLTVQGQGPAPHQAQRESHLHFIIVMIGWTGFAPWESKFSLPDSLTSAFIDQAQRVRSGVQGYGARLPLSESCQLSRGHNFRKVSALEMCHLSRIGIDVLKQMIPKFAPVSRDRSEDSACGVWGLGFKVWKGGGRPVGRIFRGIGRQ